jgi:hypothetical protein
VGAAAPTCDSKILKVGCTAATIRESASARLLAERPQRFFQMKVGALTIIVYLIALRI